MLPVESKGVDAVSLGNTLPDEADRFVAALVASHDLATESVGLGRASASCLCDASELGLESARDACSGLPDVNLPFVVHGVVELDPYPSQLVVLFLLHASQTE